MKILICFGTRPEGIKMAPVIKELQRQNCNYKVCVTGQHRQMLDQVLEFFEIKPDFDLDLMKPDQNLNLLSASILVSLNQVLTDFRPDLVLVQGDTTTALMTSLAAFHLSIPVGHIEAGLRTYNIKSPFPEESNRQIIGRIAALHFPPTQSAKENLLAEKVSLDKIAVTGNTVVDALEWAKSKLSDLDLTDEMKIIEKKLNDNKKTILVTGHRRENLGKGLETICEALLVLAKTGNYQIIYPVHLNPNVSGPVGLFLGNTENIHLIDPVTYPAMLWLIKRSDLIISDSGGIQEEAPSFHKPVLITRNQTERMEGIAAGFNTLVGTDKERIVFEAERIFSQSKSMYNNSNPFGDGTAAKNIIKVIFQWFIDKN